MADERQFIPSTSSLEELVNGVLAHPHFRNIVGNITSSRTNSHVNSEQLGSNATRTTPSPTLVPTALPSSASTSTSSLASVQSSAEGPAQELRNLFRRGTSSLQQQNLNATIPRFNSRFSYQPRGRNSNRAAPYCKKEPKGKSKGKAATTGQPFCREVVLLNNPDDSKVIRGPQKAKLHRTGNIISAFKFEKHWPFSKVYEELLQEFSQLASVEKIPKFQIMMGVGHDLVKPQMTAGQELSGEFISKIFTQRTIWLVPSEKLGQKNVMLNEQATGTLTVSDDEDDAICSMVELPPVPWSTDASSEKVDELQAISPHKERSYLLAKITSSYGDVQQAVLSILNDGTDLLECQTETPENAITKFRQQAIDKSFPRQQIVVNRSPDTIIKDVLKEHKRGSIDMKKQPDVEFIGEAGMDANALTREFCHIVMSSLKEGTGGFVLFEGEEDHLLPVHCAEYVASEYFVYVGKMIAHSILHSGKGLVGLSRALAEFLVTEDIERSMLKLTVKDVPDLEIRESLDKIQGACADEDLNLTPNEVLVLTEAGFVNELLTVVNKYRACQCVMTHVVFKARREEIDQLRKGMESISLIGFLKSSEGCLPYIFPLTDELKIGAEDFIDLIPQTVSEVEDDKKTMDWFVQYVKDVSENKRGEKEGVISALPSMAQVVQFIVGHPYLPTKKLQISFAAIPYPDPNACLSVKLPNIYNKYEDFKHAMNTAISSQHVGFGRG